MLLVVVKVLFSVVFIGCGFSWVYDVVMDAVELPLPAAITVSKLMGSSGLSGRSVGITVEDCESEQILVSPSIDSCSSLLSKKAKTAFWSKRHGPDLHRCANQSSSVQSEDVSKDLSIGNMNNALSVMLDTETKQLQRKPGKVARSSGGSSKRLRMEKVEVSLNGPVTDDIKEKTQVAKQMNNLDAKRGDKRHGKVSKSRHDSFSLKNGLLSICSASGGNINLGAYGSNPHNFDVTKDEDEVLLNELLDGSYKRPTVTKGKMKEAANSNETILHSVRKACSVLWFQKPLQPQNISEVDNGFEDKVSTCSGSSSSCLADKSDADKVDKGNSDLSSCSKDSDSKCIHPADILDFPLHQSKDILERLALPTSKDLDTLLLDSTKPTSRSNSDLRLGKPVLHRAGLPPFPWSHTSVVHFKSNSDAVKLSTSRSMCLGSWVKIGNALNFPGVTCGFPLDFESLAYDKSLVPLEIPKSRLSETGNTSSPAVGVTTQERSLLSSAKTSSSQFPSEMSERSPSLLAAAQTLYEIATIVPKRDPQRAVQRLKNHSPKAMKSCNLMSSEKSAKASSSSKSTTKPDIHVKFADEMLSSKKARLSVDEKSGGLGYVNATRQGLINWSIPRPNKSSPNRSPKDLVPEAKKNNFNYLKRSYMLPPSSSKRTIDKACDRQGKLRKLLPMEWNRKNYKLD